MSHISKKDLKEAKKLPDVSGNDFSLLAEAFRDFVLAQMEDHDDVFCVLVDNVFWDRDDAKWVYAILEKGVGAVALESENIEDPRARNYQKDKTVVRRK